MLLAVHISGGVLALPAGFTALFTRKGSPVHRYAGYVFVGAMLVMAAGAMAVGVEREKYGNLLVGPFVMYLVLTSLTTFLPPSPAVTRLNTVLRRIALPLGVACVAGGVYRLTIATGSDGGVPARSIAVASFINATVLFLGWWGDLRVVRRGPPRGAARTRRHLWRMCYAMFVASGSFFLGQAKVIPEPLRIGPVLTTLAFLPLVAMVFFLWRHRDRRPRRAERAARLEPAAAVAA
ncbi:MAG TPA: hypothetical protein VJT67_12420 [Longimicrobiaceae bacterium]|nr:hypothetical protein [Longimicrobiaceae bacterium]